MVISSTLSRWASAFYIKGLLTKLHSDSVKTVYIEAVGPCVVTAGDIKADGEVNSVKWSQRIFAPRETASRAEGPAPGRRGE